MDPRVKMRDAARKARAAGSLAYVDDVSLDLAYLPLALRLVRNHLDSSVSPRTLAIVGAPGTGKTTLSGYLGVMLQEAFGLRSARFGLDDVYLSRQSRIELGQSVHPLFAIRGAPGTHDIELMLATLRALRAADATTVTALPRFDKWADDVKPPSEWPLFAGKPDLILFDTWLWDVVPPNDEDLSVPMNRREREEDPDGVWRRTAAQALRSKYLSIFDQADEWIEFQAPNWEASIRFREEQEMTQLIRVEGAGAFREKEPSIRAFLELFERWVKLPHITQPEHRIVLDERHCAHLLDEPSAVRLSR